ncbi:hypothetical protein TWF106_001354 [Orbilia oligospora]|uniref:Uncharacterized protein n=1 Tax=Orbilia oligospora TaxID=2813651 RepID=A0A7C8U966_ORBOL|nr:hypothetical protein TWF106_001354 [Orbilia oligospora]
MSNRSGYANPVFTGAAGVHARPEDNEVPYYTPETTTDRFIRRISSLKKGPKSNETIEDYQQVNLRPVNKERESETGFGSEEIQLISRVERTQQYTGDIDGDDPKTPKALERAKVPKFSGLGFMILSLSIFSTLFSLLFFFIAVAKPRYQGYIHANGHLSPTTASLLSAIFAKAIEISFVTVFTSYTGQVLSKRALRKDSKGIRIADLLMKGWVYQPGSLLTTMPGLKYAGRTLLGVVILFVVLCVTFYTTAADSLVSPKLHFSKYGDVKLEGYVTLTYGNSTALASRCPAIISSSLDGPMNGSALPVSQTTCYRVHNSYQPLRDFTFFTDAWNGYRADQSIPRDQLNRRPVGWTTVGNERYYGAWLEISGSDKLNNVTLAMPHGSIVPSVRNVTLNNLVQPEMQSDFGNIDATASVLSPAINVICYKLNQTAVQWFISNNSSDTRQGLLDPEAQRIFNFDPSSSQSLSIPSEGQYLAPSFISLPPPFNVAIFASAGYTDPSMYILTAANATISPSYTLCAIRSLLTSRCSTNYLSASGGGNVTTNCSPDNQNSLSHSLPSTNHETYQSQFKDISTALAYALSLNVADAALSRILGIFATSAVPGFNPSLPSVAEALAILYANAIVLSSVGAQFGADEKTNSYAGVDPYPYQLPTTESFNARIRTVEYASGVSAGWQASFYVVLAGVMVMNVFCLVYFFVARGLVFDITEIENLFCVAFNSRSDGTAVDFSSRMARRRDGFYGKGPRGKQFGLAFHVDCEEDERFHLYKRD